MKKMKGTRSKRPHLTKTPFSQSRMERGRKYQAIAAESPLDREGAPPNLEDFGDHDGGRSSLAANFP